MTQATLKKGEATRARIVEAAYSLFLEQGYHGTSMRQIVERAGITMGGIYNHFAGKEAIWEAVLMAKHPYHEIMPLLLTARGDTYAEYLRHAATRLVGGLSDRIDLLNLMFIEIVEFNAIHIPDLVKSLMPGMLSLRQIFFSKRGRLRNIPPPILARSFAGLFFSYYITGALMPDEVRQLMGDDSLESFINIYLYGILDEPPEPNHDQPPE